MKPFRVLVTGSRMWLSQTVIFSALDVLLACYGPGLMIVHGACPRGADWIADEWCRRRGVPVERHPADWKTGRGAGFVRNAEMVDSRPDLCLAFIRDGSPGATHCADLAEKAGIRVRRYERP